MKRRHHPHTVAPVAVVARTFERFDFTALLIPLLTLASCLAPHGPLQAASPSVQFDVGYTVACRDVTPEDFLEHNPSERLVEARFQVTAFVPSGDADQRTEFLYTLESPQKSLRIVDYAPKTTLESDLAGNVSVENKREKAATLGVGLSGTFQNVVNANASGNAVNKSLSTIRYEKLASKELLSASGTLQRGHAVYFKLKPSERTSLEGAKEFMLVLQVPRDWQADYLHLRCQAISNRRRSVPPMNERQPCGHGCFVVALHLAGDDVARNSAEDLVQREQELRRSVQLHAKSIRKRAYPSLAHRIGGMLDVVSPQIPAGWYQYVLHSGGETEPAFVRRLPQQVASAVRNYALAKRNLVSLSGDAHSSAAKIVDVQ